MIDIGSEFIFNLENPQVYTGREINAARKKSTHNRDLIDVCLVFPDKYEIGMSHYGLIILYHLLNKIEHVNAERCFLPGKVSIEAFKRCSVPLFSLESKTPLKDFHVIGFSLLSEMNYTNVLQVLDLAMIPLRSHERGASFPVIAAGGIAAVNPEPLRDFIDVFGIGDGEAIFPDILAAVSEAKNRKENRADLLKRLDTIESLYVPSLYPPVKKGRFYGPDLGPGRIKKRVLNTLDKPDALEPDRVIVPITNVVFNRLSVEIARGCPQNCRFCQARSYYAPYRTRSLENNIRHIANGLRETGFESFSLSTLSTGDYPHLGELLQLIPDAISPGVTFSLSSLRPSTLSHHLLSTIALFKRTGITIVPEAGTQRLRNVINKDVGDEEIFQAVELALRHKWQKIKLYFMLGLPTETMEDIDGIVRLIRQITAAARGPGQKIKVHASFSSFVPKPQTPLQWAAREPMTDTWDKIGYIKKELQGIGRKYLNLDFHSPKNGFVETILARGDYRVGELLEKTFRQGEIFSAWDTEFNYPVWEKLIHHSVYEEFLKEFSTEEPLPWDFLQVNFKKEYMVEEYKKALSAEPTPSCNQMECKDCGGCLYKMKRVKPGEAGAIGEKIKQELAALQTGAGPENRGIVTYRKVRIFYEKTGDFIFFSQLGMMQYIERLLRRTGIAFKHSEGFSPRMKITSLPPLPVFAASLEEVVELFADASLNEKEMADLLNKSASPEGFKFKNIVRCDDAPPLSRDIRFIGYEIMVKGLSRRIDEIVEYLEDTDFASYTGSRLILKIDYSRQGQERFAKIYKTIDPGKKYTRHLTRTNVTFKYKG